MGIGIAVVGLALPALTLSAAQPWYLAHPLACSMLESAEREAFQGKPLV